MKSMTVSFTATRRAALSRSSKKAEDGDGVIVRMYENKNNRVRAHITSGRALVHVYECNLLEEKEAELTVCGTTFETVFKPYEIKTFRLIFA